MTLGAVIFLGAFFGVLAVVAFTLIRAAVRSYRDTAGARAEVIRWHADFDGLPARERRCRHELTGEVESRECPNEFDCRVCDEHPRFIAENGSPQPSHDTAEVAGLRLPLDRMYHRGHTWVRLESDGTYTIGLDELGQAVLGDGRAVELPNPGWKLVVNGIAWIEQQGPDRMRILSPVDGEVLETRRDGEWRIRARVAPAAKLTHLLAGTEAVAWFRREFERLQTLLSGAALADGGALVDDLEAAYPTADWQSVRGAILLEP
jgi:hypothetical protein